MYKIVKIAGIKNIFIMIIKTIKFDFTMFLCYNNAPLHFRIL